MNTAEAIGLVAGLINISSFVPQIIKAWRTRQTRDLSLATYIALSIGTILWVLYGVMIGSIAIIITNIIFLVLLFIVIALKLRFS